MLSNFERLVLGTFKLTFLQRMRLVHAARTYAQTEQSERDNFRSPYRRMGNPLMAWVLLRMAIDRPFFVIFGPITAVLCYVGSAVYYVFKLVNHGG